MLRRYVNLLAVLATCVLAGTVPLGAQPVDRQLKLVAAQETGTATDKVARLLAQALESHWQAPVIVENRPGAGGTIGAEAVARAAPDAMTLLVGGYSNLVVATVLRTDVRYDPERDFVPIGRVAHVPFVFAVHPSVPAQTLGELVDLARAKPGQLNVGSLVGGSTGMGTALLVQATGIQLTPIEYKGASTAIADLVAGRIDVMFNEIAALGAQARAGRVRLLAAASPNRLVAAPDLPTTAEAGFPSIVVAPWYGLLAPANMPLEILARVREALAAAQAMPSFRAQIAALGYESIDEDGNAFARQIVADIRSARSALTKR